MSLYSWLQNIFGYRSKQDILIDASNDKPSVEDEAIHGMQLICQTYDQDPLSSSAKRGAWAARPTDDVWQKLRQQVFQRDNWRCQITGCVNEHEHLECHHIEPVALGGTHDLDNLVTLCVFHHACQKDHDIRSIKKRADTDRYWIRLPYRRVGHLVDWHFGRRVLVSGKDLQSARNHYQLKCRCGYVGWLGYLRPRLGDLIVLCPECKGGWRMEIGLREETCVALANCLVPSANRGRLDSSSFDQDITGLRLGAEIIEACPYCFIEDNPRKCGFLQPHRGAGGDFLGCVNFSEPKIRCPYKKSLRA